MDEDEVESHEARLPDHLKDLAVLFNEWCIGDDVERSRKQDEAPDSSLRALTEAVMPRFDEIDAYLRTFGDQPPDGDVCQLHLLLECALEADRLLYMREETEDCAE